LWKGCLEIREWSDLALLPFFFFFFGSLRWEDRYVDDSFARGFDCHRGSGENADPPFFLLYFPLFFIPVSQVGNARLQVEKGERWEGRRASAFPFSPFSSPFFPSSPLSRQTGKQKKKRRPSRSVTERSPRLVGLPALSFPVFFFFPRPRENTIKTTGPPPLSLSPSLLFAPVLVEWQAKEIALSQRRSPRIEYQPLLSFSSFLFPRGLMTEALMDRIFTEN